MSGDATVIGAVATGEIARFPVFGEDGMAIPVAALRQAWIGRP
jgi:hypothetical protein